MINLEETTQAIMEILENSEFDNIQDGTGYFVIKEDKERDINRAVDVSRGTGEGTESPHYVIYVSYEYEQADWITTKDLSYESLLETLTEIASNDWEL